MAADTTKTAIPQSTGELDADQPPRRRSGFCCGCLIATAVLTFIFAVILMILFSSPEEIVARAQRSLGGADTIEKASTQLTDAQMRAVRGVKPTVQIQLSDADVNAYLNEHREELDLPSGLEDPKVAFGDGYIEGSVRTKVAFMPVRMRVEIVPEVADGKLVLHVKETEAGKIGLPGMFRNKIGRTIDKMIQQKLGQSDLRLKNLVVQPGLLTITVVLEPSDASGS